MEPLSPMLKQYHTIKNKHQDCILFFRLGDFYEMFYEDAKVAARLLDLVLTARGKGSSAKVPMCGFPHHAADNYIAKLIKSGEKVAICEQVEDPADTKGIVRRDVTRIITSGTYLDEHNTDARFLLCLNPGDKHIGIAFCDPATGFIQTTQIPKNVGKVVEIITKLPFFECIYPENQENTIKELFAIPLLKTKNILLTAHQDWSFNPEIAQKTLQDHFSVANLHGFGIENKPYAASSCGALLEYLKLMNKQPLRHINKISLYTDDDFAYIAPAAHRGLELDTLIKTLDHTVTAMGKRLFYFWFFHPLKETSIIAQRQNAIQLLLDDINLQEGLKTRLQQIPDVEKNISRLSCGYIHAKDLLSIRNTLAIIPEMIETLQPIVKNNPLFNIEDIENLRTYLLTVINEDVPLSKPEGKVIKPGFNKELDDLRNIQDNGREWLKTLQAQEIKRTGINSLKIGFNKVFGYYLEVTKTHSSKVPEDFIRKQTLVNAERFITPQLKEYEEKILTAQDKIFKIENDIIKDIQQKILDHSRQLHELCQNLARIDTLYALSKLAQSPGYICPQISDDTVIHIQEGRHPVVEQSLTDNFISNDTLLDCEEQHLVILTGPNMAGKSTYIRQTAILVIMAQVGSFIPASSAHIGIVDKVFTRIGAHDDIAKGQSTFMVEMNETADVLNNLTDRSLIILDEIGRGTSTYDGLSLAWALAEHLQTTKARTLFATHFHELTALADEFSGVKNYNVAVKEWKDEIVFLHKIIPGSTDDSYGIYVAKLAGIPKSVINRSKKILTQLELKGDLKNNLRNKPSDETQLNLFANNTDPVAKELKVAIEDIDINNLTPVEALNRINKLKEILNED